MSRDSVDEPAASGWNGLCRGGGVAAFILIVGYVPGVNDPKRILHICWSILGAGLGILVLSI